MGRVFLFIVSFVALFLSACAPILSAPSVGAGRVGAPGSRDGNQATAASTSASSAGSIAAAPTATVAPSSPSSTAQTAQSVWETFYAAIDNDPPGSLDIAYPAPQGMHTRAGGIGTYADPITLASDARWLPIGIRVYAPRWRKYYIMEDECVECEADWSANHFHHVDLFMPPSLGAGVLACEDAATKDQAENDIIILNPGPNYAVDPTPLYTDTSGCVYAAHQY